ncbi:para-aminobenzoate synthase [Echinicola pacifica]|uniref:Para-aminobenzoate synthase n=1 Tax=Echinicola pacifica TaxID=346377 RepID=A0A918Q0C3_9BACT|nr:anthranilate synthase component I family protein [Echinicola pacifica]GGZ27018.1 para-aminobenzoate synthase [Echinicola pacifica]
MKQVQEISFPYTPDWQKKVVKWALQHFEYVSFHHPQGLPYPEDGFKTLLLAGHQEIPFEELDHTAGFKGGILSYDLKNRFEKLYSRNPAIISCPDLLFFAASLRISFDENLQTCLLASSVQDPSQLRDAIDGWEDTSTPTQVGPISKLQSKEEYIRIIRRIQEHIAEGDLYELNYCMPFSADYQSINPAALYWALAQKSPMPFSSLFKAGNLWLVGASPERFLKKQGNSLLAQPIKGTIRRGSSKEEDQRLKHLLRSSEKEMAENLMIVDLMRNDLARIAKTGSVQVDELFGIYPFAQVFQMISSLSAQLDPEVKFTEIIQACFPMGSMTGAPKIKCMELIERYEIFRRGWFSGAIGYIDEEGDFDFSVIIRSIIGDQDGNKLYFAAGSAITYDADPVYEYDECLLKAKAIMEVLTSFD